MKMQVGNYYDCRLKNNALVSKRLVSAGLLCMLYFCMLEFNFITFYSNKEQFLFANMWNISWKRYFISLQRNITHDGSHDVKFHVKLLSIVCNIKVFLQFIHCLDNNEKNQSETQ